MNDQDSPRRPRRAHRLLALALALAIPFATTGCAGLPAMIAGPFTGAVDAPAQVYRACRPEFNRTPIYWFCNIIVFVPVGIMAGPIAGLVKGVSTDVQWLLDQTTYRRSMTTYRDYSIWRPYMIPWQTR